MRVLAATQVGLLGGQDNGFEDIDVEGKRGHGNGGERKFVHRHHWFSVLWLAARCAAFGEDVARVEGGANYVVITAFKRNGFC